MVEGCDDDENDDEIENDILPSRKRSRIFQVKLRRSRKIILYRMIWNMNIKTCFVTIFCIFVLSLIFVFL